MSSQPSCITFKLPAGTEYRAKLLDYKHSNKQIQVTIEVEPDVWEFVDLVMLFNLRWNVRNEGSVSGQRAVQIKMYLDGNIYGSLHEERKLIIDEETFLLSDSTHEMRSTRSWFATEVTEEVELPESLKGQGTLREGFTTKWMDGQV
jgi:hypothetical protein